MPARPITRLRKLCLALPEAHEVETWGAPTFRVRNRIFVIYASASDVHAKGRPNIWVKAAPGDQAQMVGAAPLSKSRSSLRAAARGGVDSQYVWGPLRCRA